MAKNVLVVYNPLSRAIMAIKALLALMKHLQKLRTFRACGLPAVNLKNKEKPRWTPTESSLVEI